MTQETSAQAYREELENGRIKGNGQLVALAFAQYGPGTSAEILKAAKLDKNRNLMRARITELADRGIVKADGERACEVTGRRCIVWRFVGIKGEPRKKIDKLGTSRSLLSRVLALPHRPGLSPFGSGTPGQIEYDDLRSDVLAFLKGEG